MAIRFAGILAASFFVMTMLSNAHAAPKIGVASAVQNSVVRVVGAGTQALSVGSDLFSNERIRTGDASTAQILLLDKTSLTIGPRAEITLDNFVYNPSSGAGRVVLNAIQGAVRFVSGSQNPRNYTIKTPVGNIGIRGTIGDILVQNGQVIVILVEGALTITVNGVVYTLTVPGTAFIFSANGTAQGPVTWDGTIFNAGGGTAFPLYGWQFQGEPTMNGLPNINLGGIDQLNGIIQGSLKPPGYGGGGIGPDQGNLRAR